MMKNTLGISYSKNHCYFSQLTLEKEKISLIAAASFFNEHGFSKALQTNIDFIQSRITKTTRIILTLPVQDVLLKNMIVDLTLTDEEIIYHIQSQSITLFGLAHEQLTIDYETQFIEDAHRHILVVACHQQKIVTYQRYFSKLNIPLDVIDVDVLSLLRFTQLFTDKKEFILLFHDDQLHMLITRNGQLQKYETIALTQLNTCLSPNDQVIVITGQHELKTMLDKLNFSYNELNKNPLIQNKSTLSDHELYPFYISIGAGLWRGHGH